MSADRTRPSLSTQILVLGCFSLIVSDSRLPSALDGFFHAAYINNL